MRQPWLRRCSSWLDELIKMFLTEMRPQLLTLVDGYRARRRVVTLQSPAALRRFIAAEC